MLTINGIPFSMLFILGMLGVIIFAVFSLYKRLILPIVLLQDNGQSKSKRNDRLEIIVWALFILVVVYYALIASIAVTVILLALIIFAFFDFWRNYFTGLIMKLGDKIQMGDSIIVNDHSGKVVELGNRDIKMESTSGEEILIPYRLANTEIKIGHKKTPKILCKTFTIDRNSRVNSEGLRHQIERAIYTNPWIIISSPISISFEGQKANLQFHVLNNEFFEKAKSKLERDLK